MYLKLDEAFFEQLLMQAENSPRRRSHYNLHINLNEPVQRLCIGMKKGTYVQPHQHPQANKWELLLVLRGSVGFVVFDHEGALEEKFTLQTGESLTGIEITPNTWHSIFPLSEEAVIMEVKEGPYVPISESDFAAWAPKEGDKGVATFLAWLEAAQAGDRYDQLGLASI